MAAPERIGSYIRVSNREQEEGYSLEAQTRLLAEYCAARGWPAPVIYADRGESAFVRGGRLRPGFRQLLADAEARRLDAVLVHKLDRFARNTATALDALAAIQRAGVGFVCIQLDMDFTSPVGKMIFTTMSAFAEFFSHNLGDEVRKGLAQKRLNGEWLGPVPFGARRGAAGKLTLDAAHADLLGEFLARLPEESPYAIAADFNARGLPSPRGSVWSPNTMYRMVASGGWLLDQPEPWPTLWQAARWRSRRPSVRRTYTTHLLSGLLRCPCGATLQYNGPHPERGNRYRLRCSSARLHPLAPGLSCGRRLTWAETYEAQVTDWFLALPPLRDVPRRAIRPEDEAAHQALAEERRRLVRAYRAQLMGDAEFDTERRELARREALLAPPPGPGHPLGALVATAQRVWPDLTPAARNGILRDVLDHVLIEGRTATPEPHDFVAVQLAALRGAPVG